MLAMLLMVSCVKDKISLNENGTKVPMTITATLPMDVEISRAGEANLIETVSYVVYDKAMTKLVEGTLKVDGKHVNLDLDLIKGETYNIAFWAQAECATPFTFNATDATIKADYSAAVANSDSNDAFYAVVPALVINGPATKRVTMTRPFAQINLGVPASELDNVEKLGMKITKSQMKVINVATKFDLFANKISEYSDVTFQMATLPTETLKVNGIDYTYLAYVYLFVEDTDSADLIYTLASDTKNIKEQTIPMINFKRNHRTNILGRLITSSAGFDIEIDAGELSDYSNVDDSYKIYYTTIDGTILTPSAADSFDANIVTNMYNNGIGVMTFDRSLTSIGQSAFSNCYKLKSMVIPSGVTRIGGEAFMGCTFLSNIYLSDNVELIGDYAFANCYSLTSITVPDGVTTFGHGVFLNCDSMHAFYSQLASDDKRCLILDGVLKSFAPDGISEYIIPGNVTTIGGRAFSCCDLLKSVTIPNIVTRIMAGSFSGSQSLESITIPQNAFVDDSAFDGCESLHAFYGKHTTNDNRCLIIDDRLIAFAPAGLYNYNIPDGVTEIGENTFLLCSSLHDISIPNSVVKISKKSFYSCGISRITIPESVSTIEDQAFEHSNLSEIHFNSIIPPIIGNNVFEHTDSNLKIYVPSEAVNTYKENWDSYADCILGI